ncbi:Uncharacterized protein FKW44_003395, partial [Caligus rogercresseyi]
GREDMQKLSSVKKAQVTRAVNSIYSLCQSLSIRKTSQGKSYLEDARIRLQRAYKALEDHYIELMEINPDQGEVDNEQLDEYDKKYQEALEKLLEIMALNEQPDEPMLNRAPQPSFNKTIHIDNSSLPFNLTKDHNPHELAEWAKSFKSYYTQNSIDKFPLH